MNNPVANYYPDYVFPQLPIIEFSSYQDVLSAAKNVSKSCILINKNPQTINNTQLNIEYSYDSNLSVYLVLNITLTGRSFMYVQGKNFSLTNVDYIGGDSTYDFPTHLLRVVGDKISVINFSMVNFRVGNDDLDYFRCGTNGSGKNKVINCLFDGKTNNGIFLRSDNAWNLEVFQCVFKNHDKGGDSNGGEAIRIGVSSKELDETNVLISDCYFENCVSDPEVISIKTSSNLLKRIVMTNCSDKRLVFRHGNKNTCTESFFSESGLRIYGAEHLFQNIQLVKGSQLFLDNKSGNLLPEDCTIDRIYYQDTNTPIIDEGKNNTITNVIEELKFTADDLLNGSTGPIGPTGPPPQDSDFRIYTQDGRTVENNEIYIDENFSIEYLTNIIQTYNFTVSKVQSGEIIHQKQENNAPYWLYGDNSGAPIYGFINDEGTYDLKVEQTGEVFTFYVINPIGPTGPPPDNHKFKFFMENGREIDMNNPEIYVNEPYNIEYLTNDLQTYNFTLIENRSEDIVHTKRESKEPYFMYGNSGSTIYYNSLDTPGFYVCKVNQTGDEVIFKVIEKEPQKYDISIQNMTQRQVDLIKEQVDEFFGKDSYNLILQELTIEQLYEIQKQINEIIL